VRLLFASDHRGYNLKSKLIEYFKDKYDVVDFGTNSLESCDYPDFAFKLGESLEIGDFGVVICGSGIGICIAANKVKGVRCARVINKEEAKITRCDNDSNVVSLSEKVEFDVACDIIDTFINSKFSTEEKHIRRVNKIKEYEEEHER